MAKVVVAEDEVHISRVLSLWLSTNGHQAYEARNGRLALELVRQHHADLLITDINMPVMDGIELSMSCAGERLPKLGIIVLTSRCDQANIRDQLKDLNVVFHPKPFSPSKLMREVEQLLSRAGAAKQTTVQTLGG
jgi:two-component system OmpR family response regulator